MLRIKLLKSWSHGGAEYTAGQYLDIDNEEFVKGLVAQGIAEKAADGDEPSPAPETQDGGDKPAEGTETPAEGVTAGEVEKAVDAALAKAAAKRQGARPTAVKIGNVKDLLEDDPRHGFKGIGEFAIMTKAAGMGANPESMGLPDKRLHYCKAPTGMSAGLGADGGFTVPPQFSTEIWDRMRLDGEALLPKTDNYTVEGESLTFPANAETDRTAGNRYGGVRGYWIAEAAKITESKPTFRQIKIEPKQLAVLVYATDKLLTRSPVALEQYIQRAASAEITFMTSDGIINGDGAGKPLGILSSGCKVEVAKEVGQAAATIEFENITKMWARLHPSSRANAVWYINVDVEPELDNITLDAGTAGHPAYFPPGGLADAQYGRLKGRPVVPIEFCQTLGTAGDIILADLGAYLSGTVGSVDSAMSIHLRFDYMETAFRFSFAVDGQPWLVSAITPFKGSNTLTPFVTLAARA